VVQRMGGEGHARSCGMMAMHWPEKAAALGHCGALQVRVETYVDRDGVEKVHRIRFDSRQIEIAENIDQWHGADYRYFKVRGSDGTLYMLRHNETRADWELMMYERTQSQDDPAIGDAIS